MREEGLAIPFGASVRCICWTSGWEVRQALDARLGLVGTADRR